MDQQVQVQVTVHRLDIFVVYSGLLVPGKQHLPFSCEGNLLLCHTRASSWKDAYSGEPTFLPVRTAHAHRRQWALKNARP